MDVSKECSSCHPVFDLFLATVRGERSEDFKNCGVSQDVGQELKAEKWLFG
jgi:hypothetical protein